MDSGFQPGNQLSRTHGHAPAGRPSKTYVTWAAVASAGLARTQLSEPRERSCEIDSNEYRTPPEVFEPLHREFGFTMDVAATLENALTRPHDSKTCHYIGPWDSEHGTGSTWRLALPGERCPGCGVAVGWFFTKKDDALSQDWEGERVWCNPPYSAPLVGQFVEKCAEHAKAGGLAVMLLNATTTDTRWFHKHIWDEVMNRPRERVDVRLRSKRIAFLDDKGVPQKSPRYSNMVIVFHPHEVKK